MISLYGSDILVDWNDIRSKFRYEELCEMLGGKNQEGVFR